MVRVGDDGGLGLLVEQVRQRTDLGLELGGRGRNHGLSVPLEEEHRS